MGKIINFIVLALAIMTAGFIWINGVQLVRVQGHSMDNTLHDGQTGISKAFKDESQITRNSIIIFDGSKEDPYDNRVNTGEVDFIKRVIGMPGDKIRFDGQNIYVNDKLLEQPYLTPENQTTGTSSQELDTWTLESLSHQDSWQNTDKYSTEVPKDSYFVLGDNRANSEDSRYFGYVSAKNVKAILYKAF